MVRRETYLVNKSSILFVLETNVLPNSSISTSRDISNTSEAPGSANNGTSL
ncbi:uncharacterized protein ARMOST_19090 [Armillaria ostoyae]|uniref:Uncharacterized protein n=1 Tax=Armillaria ostoyae TaxID=47428 RepID=A0A284S3M0_ARMOS|nr:uncharacterized protein ARMOST_19090 [Armillaria ostoyae]